MEQLHPQVLYKRGLDSLSKGNARLAVKQLRAALVGSRQRDAKGPPRRYVSYYGLAMALAFRPSHESIALCERAARGDAHDPVLQHNLARIYSMAGKTSRALEAIEQGLRADPTNRRLRVHLDRLNRRSPPMVPVLSRDHPLNRSLGHIRARFSEKS